MAPIRSSIRVHPRLSAVESIFTGLPGSRRIHHSISKSASICVHPWFLLMNECEPRMNTDQHGSEKSHSAARVPKGPKPAEQQERGGRENESEALFSGMDSRPAALDGLRMEDFTLYGRFWDLLADFGTHKSFRSPEFQVI